MNSRLLKQGSVLWLRMRFSSALASEKSRLPSRIEGEYFHGVMSSRPAYYVGKTLTAEVNDASQPLREFLDTPCAQSLHNVLLCEQIVKDAPKLPSSSVKAILLKLHSDMRADAEVIRTGGYRSITGALSRRSQVLIQSQESLELEFTLADLFYRIHCPHIYASSMVKRQATALKYLTESDFIQHLFFSSLSRVLEPETSEAVPYFVDNVFPHLDLEEVALVCFVLYTTQYRLLRTDQWFRIVDVFEKHDRPVSDLVLGVLAKYLRYITPEKKSAFAAMKKFLDVAAKRRSEWTLSTSLRMANIGTKAHVCNEVVLKEAMTKMVANLDWCRIKDVALGLYTNGFFGLDIEPSTAKNIIKRLNEIEVNDRWHQWLVRATYSLAMMGIYDEDLLVKSLNREVIHFGTTHEYVWFDVFALYTVCRLMFPHLLEDRISLTSDDMRYPREKVLMLTESLRSYHLTLKYMQLILQKDLGLNQELRQTLELYPFRDIHIENKVIIACHAEHFYSMDGRLLGAKRLRVVLLKAANYKVVEIHPDFSKLRPSQKLQFLRQELGKYIEV